MLIFREVDHFEDLPERLKALLARKGVSQRELHKLSGVSISRISEYTNGKGGPPTLSTLNRILEALGATRDDLFSERAPLVDEGEVEVRRLASRIEALEEQNSFFETEFGRLELVIEGLKKAPKNVGSNDESGDADEAN